MLLTTKKILIIEREDRFTGNSLLSVLEKEGYAAKSVLYDKEGAGELPDEPFTAIIVDTKIPLIDSIRIITGARSLNPDVVVILATIHSGIEAITEARKGLQFDYVIHSFEPKTIIHCINASAKRRQIVRNLEMLNKTPKILIVDDEAMITNLLEMSLHDEGLPVETANCGRDA